LNELKLGAPPSTWGTAEKFYQVTDDEGHMPTGKTYGPVRIMYLLFPATGNIIPAGTCIFTHTQA